MSSRELVGEPDLCRGGRILSIVFCCNNSKCPILKHVLNKLGLSYEDYANLKEKNGFIVKTEKRRINLAFSRSLESNDDARDEALKKAGWTVADYLAYKARLLEELKRKIDRDKQPLLKERVIKPFIIEATDADSNEKYRGIALGSIILGFMLLRNISGVGGENVSRNDEFIGVKVPKKIVAEIDRLIATGHFSSRSDAVRLGLSLVLHLKREEKELKEEIGASLQPEESVEQRSNAEDS